MQQYLALPVIMVVIKVVILTGQTNGATETEYATESCELDNPKKPCMHSHDNTATNRHSTVSTQSSQCMVNDVVY